MFDSKHSAPALTTLSDDDLAPVKGGWCRHGGGKKRGGYGGYKDHGGRSGRGGPGGGSSDSFSSSNAAANAQNVTNVTTNVVIDFSPQIVAA